MLGLLISSLSSHTCPCNSNAIPWRIPKNMRSLSGLVVLKRWNNTSKCQACSCGSLEGRHGRHIPYLTIEGGEKGIGLPWEVTFNPIAAGEWVILVGLSISGHIFFFLFFDAQMERKHKHSMCCGTGGMLYQLSGPFWTSLLKGLPWSSQALLLWQPWENHKIPKLCKQNWREAQTSEPWTK